MGLSGALSIAGRSLEVVSAGIQVSSNNIANANTPGYIREQLELASGFPATQGGLVLGTGVYAVGIRQQIDKFLEKRLYTASSDFEGAKARDVIYKQLETALQELGDSDLSTQVNNFLGTINNLINQPESPASRELVVRQGQYLADGIVQLRTRIDALRSDFSVHIRDLVTEANRLIDQIADLNPKITALEAAGLLKSDAGGMRSQRYAALTRLAEIVPIRTVDHDTGGIDVYLGMDNLVIPGKVQHLETVPRVDRGTVVEDVRVEGNSIAISGTQGEINGTTHGRDQVLGGFVDKLDQYVSNLIFEFNKIHASGSGLRGLTDVTGSYQVSDPTAGLDAAGLPFEPGHGSFQVRVVNQTTGIAQTSTMNVDLDGIGANTTLNGLITQLNGIGNVTASLTTDRRLRLTTAAGYEIEFANDTSGVLAALGVNTFFVGTSSSDIDVNAALAADADLFASGQGGGAGDGRNAVLLAGVTDNPLAALGNLSLDKYYDTTISSIAQSSASEGALADGYQGFRDALLNQRAQHSGVSLDEEAIQIMKLQRAYQISAKFISTIDSLFTALLQM